MFLRLVSPYFAAIITVVEYFGVLIDVWILKWPKSLFTIVVI